MDKYYKVVRLIDSKNFTSVMSKDLPPDFILNYAIGKETKKVKYSLGIFSFDLLEDARMFAHDYGWSIILVGNGVKSKKQSIFYCSYLRHLGQFYRYYLAGKNMNNYHFADGITFMFTGTIFLDSFTPERIVESKQLVFTSPSLI